MFFKKLIQEEARKKVEAICTILLANGMNLKDLTQTAIAKADSNKKEATQLQSEAATIAKKAEDDYAEIVQKARSSYNQTMEGARIKAAEGAKKEQEAALIIDAAKKL